MKSAISNPCSVTRRKLSTSLRALHAIQVALDLLRGRSSSLWKLGDSPGLSEWTIRATMSSFCIQENGLHLRESYGTFLFLHLYVGCSSWQLLCSSPGREQPTSVNLLGVNVNRREEARFLNVKLSLCIPVEEEESALNPNVKAICIVRVSSRGDTVVSLSCKSKHVLSPEMLLQGSKESWKGVATSWYAIVGYVLVGVAILAGLLWLLYPKVPEVTLESLQLHGLTGDAKLPSKDTYYLPKLAVDLNMMISLRIRNPNFIGVSYEKISVYVKYNEYQLCHAEVNGDEIAPREKSTVNANVKVKFAQIFYNAPNLLADAAMQELPVNLVVEFSGYVGSRWFKAPVAVSLSLDAKVDVVSAGSRWFKAPVAVSLSLDAKVDVVSADVVEQDFHLV